MGKEETKEVGFSLLSPGGSMNVAHKAAAGERARGNESGRRVIHPYEGMNERYHEMFGAEVAQKCEPKVYQTVTSRGESCGLCTELVQNVSTTILAAQSAESQAWS
ncbi:hypothetical protein PENSPDRAFT_668844 [Peniophora sp. CONT]|nr:hypothetical protein PENSPDRAFT_668844 [Peniophora sp. CONT]